jgi:hypothetical protein
MPIWNQKMRHNLVYIPTYIWPEGFLLAHNLKKAEISMAYD